MDELAETFAALDDSIKQGVRDLGWTTPTPVQEKTLPLMRSGSDMIVQAHTGSGKTGAFGIPIAEALDPELAFCQAIVLVPTRELAIQVAEEVAQIGRHKGIRTVPIYGGVGYQQQIDGIEAGAHLVVGTPGRILDHLGSGRLDLSGVKILIFDEADEMLSLGFWPDMREIQKYLPKKKQACLFSATIPERVASLARVFLDDPAYVSPEEGQLAPQQIEHFFIVTTARDKDANLIKILEYEDPESAIIFCNTKSDVRSVTMYLQRRGCDADQISGDLTQAARELAMGAIKAGKLRFLVATDVAARGIDISDLSHVIGYSAPDSPEVYVHRTGRTGRAGKAGMAISLVSGLDIGNFRYLQKINKIEIRERKVPTVAEIRERHRDRLMVKIEQEMRALPESLRKFYSDRFVPVVEEMASTKEGRRDLAAICAAYLKEHRPETNVAAAAPKKPAAGAALSEDEDRRNQPPRSGGGDGRGRGGPGGGRSGGGGRGGRGGGRSGGGGRGPRKR